MVPSMRLRLYVSCLTLHDISSIHQWIFAKLLLLVTSAGQIVLFHFESNRIVELLSEILNQIE